MTRPPATPARRRSTRAQARRRLLSAAPAAFLAAPPRNTGSSVPSPLHVLGNVADLAVQHPLPMTALVLGGGAAGAMKVRSILAEGKAEDDGFATRRQLRKHMGSRQLVRRRGVLRPSLAEVPARKVPAHEVGTYLGKDRKSGLRVYAAIEDSTLMVAPMGSGKTAKLGNWVLDAPGPVVATSTKYDLVELTEPVRSQYGRVWCFNPQGLGDRASDLLWDPVIGCADPVTGPETAMRRARYLLEGSDATKGVENRNFWQTASYRVLKAFLWAADVEGLDLRDVARWAKQPHATPALDIFDKHADIAPDGWADDLRQVQEVKGKPTTTENVFGTLAMSFEFLSLPRVAATIGAAHQPGARVFDVEAFTASGRETVYLLARGADLGGVGPLFSALVGEIYEAARASASVQRGGRLDPPLTLALDEAALICPVPLQEWTADSRGLGITVHSVFQSPAQVHERWGKYAFQTIWDNCVKVVLGGLSNREHLEDLSALCGVRTVKVPSHSTSEGSDGKVHSSTSYTQRDQPVLRPDEIKDLPVGQMLVLRRSLRPVIVRYEPVWDRRDVKALEQARKRAARTGARASKQSKQATPAGNPWAPAPAEPAASAARPRVNPLAPAAETGAGDRAARPQLKVVQGQVVRPEAGTSPVPPPRPQHDPTVHLAPPSPQPPAAGGGADDADDVGDLGAF